MPIRVECPTCGTALKAPDELAGKPVRCPQCRTRFEVPEPIFEAEEVAPPPPPPAPPVGEGYALHEEPAPAQPPPQKPPEDRRPCPACGELIRTAAVKCRFCGKVLDPTLRRARKKARGQDEDSDLS